VTENGLNVADVGLLHDVPSNAPVRITVRVYVVRASGLSSRDLNGKSDPYLIVKLGSRVIDDQENGFKQQLDPTFGR
jgi:Ca2+-dependent lipid-binding protein